MITDVPATPEPVVLRPPFRRRQLAALYAVLGLAFLTWRSVASIGHDTASAVAYATFIPVLAVVAALGLTARAVITPDGVRSRVFVPVEVPASDVLALSVIPRRFAWSRVISVAVHRDGRRPLLLSQTTVRDTPGHRAVYERQLPAWRAVLGVDARPVDGR